jgi:hypothetical protein
MLLTRIILLAYRLALAADSELPLRGINRRARKWLLNGQKPIMLRPHATSSTIRAAANIPTVRRSSSSISSNGSLLSHRRSSRRHLRAATGSDNLSSSSSSSSSSSRLRRHPRQPPMPLKRVDGLLSGSSSLVWSRAFSGQPVGFDLNTAEAKDLKEVGPRSRLN